MSEEVIIFGAGIAGLSAAYYLKEKRKGSLTLEASNRNLWTNATNDEILSIKEVLSYVDSKIENNYPKKIKKLNENCK